MSLKSFGVMSKARPALFADQTGRVPSAHLEERLAVRWALKCNWAWCLFISGIQWPQNAWRCLEVKHDSRGKPRLVVTDPVLRKLVRRRLKSWDASLSHSRRWSMAVLRATLT